MYACTLIIDDMMWCYFFFLLKYSATCWKAICGSPRLYQNHGRRRETWSDRVSHKHKIVHSKTIYETDWKYWALRYCNTDNSWKFWFLVNKWFKLFYNLICAQKLSPIFFFLCWTIKTFILSNITLFCTLEPQQEKNPNKPKIFFLLMFERSIMYYVNM